MESKDWIKSNDNIEKLYAIKKRKADCLLRGKKVKIK